MQSRNMKDIPDLSFEEKMENPRTQIPPKMRAFRRFKRIPLIGEPIAEHRTSLRLWGKDDKPFGTFVLLAGFRSFP